MTGMTGRKAPLAVISVTLAIAYGIWYGYSVILVALLAEFGWSRSLLAGAFSVFTLVHGAWNPVVGMLCARFRPLHVSAVGGAAMGIALFANSSISSPLGLYLLFGATTAVAISTAGWIPALVYVQRNYQDRLGLSIGIVSSGVGVGMMLVVPLAQLLIDAFGWRTTFQVLGVISVAWIVPANVWLMRRPLVENRGQSPISIQGQVHNTGKRENSAPDPEFRPVLTLREAARTQAFWLILAAFLFGNLCSQTLHVHQVAYLVDHGLAAIVGATVVGVVGAASIVGKTFGGWLSDRIEREFVYVGGIAILILSALALLALGGAAGSATSAVGAYGYAVLLGVGYSVTATITPAMLSDRFGGPHFGAIVGAGLFCAAVGSAIGPWVAGRVYDATGSYTVPFLVAAGCGVIAGATGWRARMLRRRAA